MALVTTHTASFDGIDLATITGLTILATDPFAPAKRTLSMNQLARSNSSRTNAAFYEKKTITLRIGISRTTRDLAEQSFDSLMAILQGIEKTLLLKQSGGLRSYTATYLDTVRVNDGGSYLEFNLVFETADHFGYDPGITQLVFASGRTLYNYTDPITIGGSADWQAPIVKITFAAVTGASNKDVIIKNPATGQALTVNRTWLAGDVLIADAKNNSVTVNGVDVPISGKIPLWSVGAGALQTTDGMLTRTKTIYAYYCKRYV